MFNTAKNGFKTLPRTGKPWQSSSIEFQSTFSETSEYGSICGGCKSINANVIVNLNVSNKFWFVSTFSLCIRVFNVSDRVSFISDTGRGISANFIGSVIAITRFGITFRFKASVCVGKSAHP